MKKKEPPPRSETQGSEREEIGSYVTLPVNGKAGRGGNWKDTWRSLRFRFRRGSRVGRRGSLASSFESEPRRSLGVD